MIGPDSLARLVAGRVHYAWITVGVMFTVILATVGVRAAPGVLIVPLENAFGWSATTISGAISLNILLGGLIAPFGAALIQRIGLRGTVLCSLTLLAVGSGGAAFARTPWELYLDVGRAGGDRLGRRHVRHGDGGGEPLVRRAARPGGWPADGEQRQRTTGVPAVAGEPGRASGLAERALGGGAGDRGADTGGGAGGGRQSRQHRPGTVRRGGRGAELAEYRTTRR